MRAQFSKEGGGGLDDTKVIKVSKQVNVKSGSNSDLFPCQRIMSLIYSPGVRIATVWRNEHPYVDDRLAEDARSRLCFDMQYVHNYSSA